MASHACVRVAEHVPRSVWSLRDSGRGRQSPRPLQRTDVSASSGVGSSWMPSSRHRRRGSASDMPPSTIERDRDRGRPGRVDVRSRLAIRRTGAGACRPGRAAPPLGCADRRCRLPGSDPRRPGVELAAQGALERTRDDLLGVRVVPQVGRDRVDRLLVAVQWVEPVDAAVVEPVREHLLPARAWLRLRCLRARARRPAPSMRVSSAKTTCGEWGFCASSAVSRARPGAQFGRVSRLQVIRWCGQSKRFVRRSRRVPSLRGGIRRGPLVPWRAMETGPEPSSGRPGTAALCVRGTRRRGRRHRGLRGRRIGLRRGLAGRRAGGRIARRAPRRVRVRRHPAPPRRPVGRHLARHDRAARRVDRSDDRLVDRRRPQLGHVQPERRVRRVPRAGRRARRSGSAGGGPARRVGARARRRESSSPGRSSRRRFPRSTRAARGSGGSASRSATGTRSPSSRRHRPAAGALARRVARAEDSRCGSSADCSRTSPCSLCC